MKFTLLLSALASASIPSVLAVAESTSIHLRVHHVRAAETPARVAEYDQCKFEGKTAMDCQTGLVCRVQDDFYGQCLKELADAWGACAGKGWEAKCKGSGKCVPQNDYYSQCLPLVEP